MKSLRRGIVVGLFLAFLAGGWWVWNQRQEIGALKSSLPAPEEHAAGLRRLAELRAKIRDLQRSGAGAATGGGDSHAAEAAWVDRLKSPETQRLLQIQYRTSMETAYGPLFRSLQALPGVTPARLGQFKELLLQEQAAVLQASLAARDQAPEEMARAVAAAIASSDQGFRSVLGDEAYGQYRQYVDTLPQRAAVTLVGQNLDPGVPKLTEDQTTGLIALLSQNPAAGGSLNVQSDVSPVPNIFRPDPAGISKAALAAAPGILAPEQLPALEAVRQQQQLHLQLLNWIAQSEQNPPGAGQEAESRQSK